MIQVLLNWFFIAITTYIIGYSVITLIGRWLAGTDELRPLYILLIGMCAVNVYAEIWSIFDGLGFTANIVLITVCMGLLCILYKPMLKSARAYLHGLGIARKIVYIILILLMAYGTSRGYMHFDTNLYHAQAIRWLEEYGVVPGLANLSQRYGYNSAALPLTALYAIKWHAGQSLHTTAGYFALLSALFVVDIEKVFREKRVRVSDFVRLGLIYYLGVIFSEMVSPASDYYAQTLIFDIVIMWLDIDEVEADEFDEVNRDKHTAKYALLCILIVYAVTIKLSIGLLVLFTIKPAIRLIKDKQYKTIVTSLITGVVVALPYFIRNLIISGWLLYPSTIIGLKNADWTVPKGMAQYDAMEIGCYGRRITDVRLHDTPFAEWIGPWFAGLSTIDKLWILAAAISILLGFLYHCHRAVAIRIKAAHVGLERSEYLEVRNMTLVFFVLTVGTAFWFFSAPLIRYGYAYIIILPLLIIGYYCCYFTNRLRAKYLSAIVWIILLIGIGGLKIKSLTADIIRTVAYPNYVYQQDYIDGEAYTYQVDGATIYVANDGGQIGYYKFPASPMETYDFELRGDDISQGFKMKDYLRNQDN